MFADFLRIKIYLPWRVESSNKREIVFPKSLPKDGFLADLIEKIKEHDTIGRLGNYEAVYEIGPGLEGYTPREKAVPTSGNPLEASRVQNVAFITYAPATAGDEVDRFVEEVSKSHPWEYPVIEISTVRMWAPQATNTLT